MRALVENMYHRAGVGEQRVDHQLVIELQLFSGNYNFELPRRPRVLLACFAVLLYLLQPFLRPIFSDPMLARASR